MIVPLPISKPVTLNTALPSTIGAVILVPLTVMVTKPVCPSGTSRIIVPFDVTLTSISDVEDEISITV